jgi:hypothetical protein
MPVIIPPGFALLKVLMQQAQTGLHLSNSYGIDLGAPLSQSSVNTLSTSIASSYRPMLATGSLYSGIHVVEGQDGAPLVWDSVTGADFGTRVISSPTTPQVQFLCDKKTPLGGRKFRGRTFLPDVAEADVGGNGAVSAGALTLLTTFCAAVVASLLVGDLDGMVLLHSDSTAPTVVTAFQPDPFGATMRSRYPR